MNKKLPEFIAAYSNASQELKDLIDSSIIGDYISSLDKIPSGYRTADLIAESANYILGISTAEEIEVMLLPLGYTTIEAGQIIIKLKNLSSSTTQTANPIVQLQPEPGTTPSIRTMASDSKQIGYSSVEEPTYTTMQSAIINERK